ncbi:hypothetical protein MHYP_G00120070 [Metynnis hypsauchen]
MRCKVASCRSAWCEFFCSVLWSSVVQRQRITDWKPRLILGVSPRELAALALCCVRSARFPGSGVEFLESSDSLCDSVQQLPVHPLLCVRCPAIAFLCSEFKKERCHGDSYLGVPGLVWAEPDSWWTETAVPGIPHMFGVCVFGHGE